MRTFLECIEALLIGNCELAAILVTCPSVMLSVNNSFKTGHNFDSRTLVGTKIFLEFMRMFLHTNLWHHKDLLTSHGPMAFCEYGTVWHLFMPHIGFHGSYCKHMESMVPCTGCQLLYSCCLHCDVTSCWWTSYRATKLRALLYY